MITAKHVFHQAMILLNYTNAYGEPDLSQHSDLAKRALGIVNQVYADLFFAEDPHRMFDPVDSLDHPVALSDKTAADIMPYGVAMLIAQSESDGENQALYAALYNRKRTGIHGCQNKVIDVLPTIGCED